MREAWLRGCEPGRARRVWSHRAARSSRRVRSEAPSGQQHPEARRRHHAPQRRPALQDVSYLSFQIHSIETMIVNIQTGAEEKLELTDEKQLAGTPVAVDGREETERFANRCRRR